MYTLKIFPIIIINWRPIYKVIDTSFFVSTKIFPTELFLYQCKNNPNKPQNIPSEVKVALKLMDI